MKPRKAAFLETGAEPFVSEAQYGDCLGWLWNIMLSIMGVVRTCIGGLHAGNECSWHLGALRDRIEPLIFTLDPHNYFFEIGLPCDGDSAYTRRVPDDADLSYALSAF
jgi:hypothetical protein